MRSVVWSLLAGLALLTLAAQGRASEADESRFTFRPQLGVTYEVNDNANLKGDGEDRDFVHGLWIEPMLELGYQRAKWSAGADLGADIRYAFNESRLRDEFLDLTAWAEAEPLRGLTLRVSNSYVPQTVRLGEPSDDVSNLRQANLLRGELRYRLERERGLALELGVRGSRFLTEGFPARIDTDGDGIAENLNNLHSDYWDVLSFVEAQHSIGRHSLAYLRGELRDRQFDELPRSDLQEWASLLGLRSEVARRLELDLAVGWGHVDYRDLGSESRLIGRADLDYAMPRGWELKGSFIQRFTSDVSGNDFDESTARLRLSKSFGRRTRASLSGLWSIFRTDTPDSDYDLVTAVEASLTRQLTRRLEAVLAYRHWRNGGSNQTQDFNQNRVTLGLTYRR